MNRKKKLARNIVILLILFAITFSRGIYLTPMAAHKASERSIHYGPSKVVHIEDFEGGKLFLGKYDKWFSCNTINRTMLLFWRFGNQVTGGEIDITKPLNFSYSSSHDTFKFYGIINDKNIDKVEVHLKDGSIYSQREFYDDMFLFTWDWGDEFRFSGIKAYDALGNVIYEDFSWSS